MLTLDIQKRLRREDGQGMLEYAILVTVLVGVIAAGVTLFGGAITAKLTTLAGTL
jgi:Flp pilus assembly pilin Flp